METPRMDVPKLSAIDLHGLQRSIEVAAYARSIGNRAFGAVLIGPDGLELYSAYNTVQVSRDVTDHAETRLVRIASVGSSREVLEQSTLYTSTEPCAMCAGAIYLAGIQRVLFALDAGRCLDLIDESGTSRPPSLRLPCREVFLRGERPAMVTGNFLTEEAEALFK